MTEANPYPLVEPHGTGFRVRVSKGAYLPGVYLTYIMAEKAKMKYLGGIVEYKQKRDAKG